MKVYVLKRYKNRKLYSTELKGYVTIDQIKALLRLGNSVQVIDFVTKANVTTQILTRAVLEEVADRRFNFDESLTRDQLKQVIAENINHVLE